MALDQCSVAVASLGLSCLTPLEELTYRQNPLKKTLELVIL